MRTSLILAAFALVVCVQCKPSADVDIKLSELKNRVSGKRSSNALIRQLLTRARGDGAGAGVGEKPGKRPEEGDKKKPDQWPVGWMEFANLIGHCVIGEMVDMPEETVLATACPEIMTCAEDMEGITMEQAAMVEHYLRQAIPVMQCVNLVAVAEFTTMLLDGADNEFYTETKPLFDMCMAVFHSYAEEGQEAKDEMTEVDANITDDSTKRVAAALRSLIAMSSKQ